MSYHYAPESRADSCAQEAETSQSGSRRAGADTTMLNDERDLSRERNKNYEAELSIVQRELQDAKTLARDQAKELVETRASLSKLVGGPNLQVVGGVILCTRCNLESATVASPQGPYQGRAGASAPLHSDSSIVNDSGQDGRDDPQSLQLNSQAQALINTQQELAEVKGELRQATQTIGQLFLEKRQSQQRIHALKKQVDKFLGARPSLARPTTSSPADQDGLFACSQELRRTLPDLKSSENEQKRLREIVEVYECELSSLRQELQETKSVSDKGCKELVGTAVSPGKADTVLVSVGKVVVLNGEIFGAAAILGGSMESKPPEAVTGRTTKTFNLARASTRSYINEKLINILIRESRANAKSYPNPLLVQVVLRVFLVKFCSGITAVTPHSYTRPAVEGWIKQLLQDLGHVLHVAHWTPNILQQECFQKKLGNVFTATEDLHNTLGEDFTFGHHDIAFIKAGPVFQPSLMEDAYGDSRRMAAEGQDPQEIVIATVGIGLKKATKKPLANGEVLYEHAVLPAKVALESTLMEALVSGRKGEGI